MGIALLMLVHPNKQASLMEMFGQKKAIYQSD